MKAQRIALLACWLAWQLSGCADAPTEKSLGEKWGTDLPAAEAQAKAEGKLILMDFEGSDWCPACIVLRREVFPTQRFASYARTNLVLMEVDFPENKDLPPALKKANDKLSRDYKVDGIPALLLLNAEGKELGRLEYVPGDTPEVLIAQMEKLKPGS